MKIIINCYNDIVKKLSMIYRMCEHDTVKSFVSDVEKKLIEMFREAVEIYKKSEDKNE